ncbi:protein translocase subunit SecD [Permianibacter sp. IMCC34836]|uniref:protein translocase subunit SecD n=1 Tax=Permianibacter fluminis TaxID=2738515 RepID=UPI0015528D26|nr:protein translocase subunit SecD [Permianibacter fluminis]NQD38163.1 protein translocase subunit SecD [Permianibacter fluminis]
MLFGTPAPRPLNTYPAWKYVIVTLAALIAIFYSIPNYFGEDAALQLAGEKGAKVTAEQVEQVKQALQAANLTYKSVELEESGSWLIRFTNTDDQLHAQTVARKALGDGYNVALNLAPATPNWLRAIHADPLKLGLDLRGGVHFLMEIDMATAIAKHEEALVEEFKGLMRDENLRYVSTLRRPEGGVQVRFRDAETRDKAQAEVKRRNPTLQISDGSEGELFFFNAVQTEQGLRTTRDEAVQQNLTILRNRVNELGVAEPLIQRQGAERIVVQLPGIQDSARAKEILGATATLEFRSVNEERDVQDALRGRVPADSELLYDLNERPILVKKQVIVQGSQITGASQGLDQNGMPQVSVKLDGKGGQRMLAHTKQSVGKRMASVLIEYKTEYEEVDGQMVAKPNPRKVVKVINAATIQGVFSNNFQITGIGSAEEARNLALLLRSGALIAPIQIVEERTIGPSLGKANIESGVKSAGIGVAAVMIFMLFYYRMFGLFANIAVAVNIGLIIALMSMIGAVMTLPGIAGLVLTVGMAVDANVLIYERIKDEIREGTNVQLAIDRGYARAFATLVDAHLTTLIAALALLAVGSGAVKGFAVTLSLGIPTTIFTATMGARALTNLVYGNRNVKKLAI